MGRLRYMYMSCCLLISNSLCKWIGFYIGSYFSMSFSSNFYFVSHPRLFPAMINHHTFYCVYVHTRLYRFPNAPLADRYPVISWYITAPVISWYITARWALVLSACSTKLMCVQWYKGVRYTCSLYLYKPFMWLVVYRGNTILANICIAYSSPTT